MELKKSAVIIDGGLVVKNKKTDHRSLYLYALLLLTAAAMPLSAFAQGSIFGTVQNSDLSTPADGQISFFGYLDDTDEEIRIETSIGAGYGGGYWFDDFQNYLTEAAGNPYDYHFHNTVAGEGFHLQKLIPNNSFQQEDILLAAVTWPAQPVGLSATSVSSSSVVVSWNYTPGNTYHVYRQVTTSSGSFFRIDDPTGSLANPGVAGSFFVDAAVDGASWYGYLIIAEDASENLSQHSAVATVNSAVSSAPIVNSIDPDSGSWIGGTSVNIYGSGFDVAGVNAVVGATSLMGITVVSPYHITGTTQAGPPGPADVYVTNIASALTAVISGGFTYVVNSTPVLAAIGPQTVVEGSLLSFSPTASDADGGIPVMTSSALPGTATFVDNGDGTGSFDWTPGFVEAGAYNVTFYATDDIDPTRVDSEQVVITVTEAGNQAPILAAIGPQTGTENVLLTFGVSASDPDTTIPALTTTALPTGAVFTDNGDGTGSFDWTPDFTQSGSYPVTFYATDDSAAVDSETVTITVIDAGNQAPVLAAIGPQGTTEGIQLLFGMSATDPDGTTPFFTTSPLPTGAILTDNGNGTATFDWTPGFTQTARSTTAKLYRSPCSTPVISRPPGIRSDRRAGLKTSSCPSQSRPPTRMVFRPPLAQPRCRPAQSLPTAAMEQGASSGHLTLLRPEHI
jgi:hypothetical protein